MKRLSIILSCLVSVQLLFAQGTLTFLNTPTATGTPGGAPVTTLNINGWPNGTRVEGPTWWSQLYSSTTPNGTYSAIGVPVNFRTGTAAGFINPSTVTVPGAAPGTSVWIQMRAWNGAAGSTYEGSAPYVGFSYSINVGPLGGPDPAGGTPFFAPFLTGLQGFVCGPITPIPEPATWMLCLSGLALVVARRSSVHRTPPMPTI